MSLDKNNKNLQKKVENIHQKIIDACVENDQKAQYKIYNLYYKAMYNSAIRILNNKMEAEDVMQEAFLDAFRNIHQYDRTATFGAWLKRIVINKSINNLRKTKNFDSFEELNHEIEDIRDEEHLETVSFKIEEILKCIEKLPTAYRIIISLYLLEGYDHEEISKILNISYNATRTKYSRAKQKLIILLKQFSDLTNIAKLN